MILFKYLNLKKIIIFFHWSELDSIGQMKRRSPLHQDNEDLIKTQLTMAMEMMIMMINSYYLYKTRA